MSRREAWLSAAAALFGLAIAIALVPVWEQPPPPGQLPSGATAAGVDARAPMRFILTLIVLILALPALLRPALRRLAEGRAWARNAAAASFVAALWLSLISKDLAWVIVPPAIVVVACVLLRDRDLRFTTHDAILVPTFAALFLSLTDVAPGLTLERVVIVSGLLLLALRIAVTYIGGSLAPAFAFAVAPIGIALQMGFFPPALRYFGWHALLIAIVTPFVLRRFLRDRRRAVLLIALVVYPIVAYSYTNATSLATGEGKPRANFFEDGHHILPAGEMLRGEKLYRDIVPVHGLVEDGIGSYIPMRVAGVTVGDALNGRLLIGGLNAIAVYALGVAVTGSAAGGIYAYFLAALFGAAGPSLRVFPTTATLALIASAVRTRKPLLFAAAGFGTAVAVMSSLDFGLYTSITLLVMVVRQPFRWRALRPALIGGLAATGSLFIALAAFGVAGDFVRSTLFEIAAASSTGTLNVFTAPQGLNTFAHVPEALAAIFEQTSAPYVIWIITAVFVATVIMRRARRGLEPLALLGLWIVIAAISYAHRHHLFFHFETAPFLAGAAWLLWRRRSPYAPLVTLGLLMIGSPTRHMAIASWLRHARGPVDTFIAEIVDLPRARGALFATTDAAAIAAARRYAERALLPQETFYDFTDRPMLYFLLRRDCPIRWPVVLFYQTDDLQRQVIAKIEGNPNVRAALVPRHPNQGIDGVSNAIRAPLVWQYLQANFRPDYEEGDVVFLRRVESSR